MPPLATITAIDTTVDWNLVQRPTALQPFCIQRNLEIHHVAAFRIFPGIKAKMLDAVLQTEKLKGLVLETFGAGNAPSGHDNAMLNVISDAVGRGIVIVNVTQCLTGSVNPLYAAGMVLSKAGVIAGADMTTEAALTKLSYLLALPGATPESVTRLMEVSVRGELSEHSATIFKHPQDTLSDPVSHVTYLTAIAYAITNGDLDRVKDVLREGPGLLNRPDYSGNTPLHLAATGPNLRILRWLLQQGASVHVRNYTGSGRTALFLAANAGRTSHASLLSSVGAHLHAEELETARLHASQRPDAWAAAGLEIAASSSIQNGLSNTTK